MALTTCFECGREISDLAVACPGCGAPGRPESPPAAAPASPRPEAQASPRPGPPEDADAPDEPGETLEEIRAAWRSEHPSAEPTGPAPFAFGSSLGEKWSARKVLYIVVGITLVAALINPGLATTAIFAGIVYWAANHVLAPGGRAAAAEEGSWVRTAQGFWDRIGLPGRVAVSAAIGVLLGFVTGALG